MTIYQDIDQIVSTTHDTVNKLTKYKNGGDALILYFRYVQQKKMQDNNQTYSCDDFMMKAMGWSRDKFYKVKKILVENGLIEPITKKNEQGKVMSWYVKVNFVINTNKNHNTEKPHSGKTDTNTPVVNTNTPIKNKREYTLFYKERLFSSFGLSIAYIDETFDHKKSLERIYEICAKIQCISDYYGVKPVYNKDSINTTDIMLKKRSVDEIINNIDKFRVDIDDGDYIDIIRCDYWLPYLIDNVL